MADDKKFKLHPFLQLWDVVSGFFTAQANTVWKGFINNLVEFTRILIEWLEKYWVLSGENFVEWTLDDFEKSGWIDAETKDDLKRFTKYPFPFNVIFGIFTSMTLHLSYIKTLLPAITADIGRHLRKKYRPENAQPREMIPASFIAPELQPVLRKVLEEAGFPDDQIDLLFVSMYKMYDENMIRELYLRGVLDEAKMFERMRENGYTDTRIKEMVQAWSIIPGPSDLFHLVAKEAFEPDMIEHYGYDEEFPVEQSKWLRMQGISDYWAKKYWYAHWETPSIQQGFEMLHRGVIDYKELNDLFRTIEIPPFWREKLTEIAFMPYTRVDTRRMHKTGTLTTDELMKAYMDVGYNEERALKMTEFTIQYNNSSGKSLTKSQIINGFDEYILTYEEAKGMLIMLKYGEDEADFLLTFADYERTKAYQKEVIKTIKKRNLLGLLTHGQSEDELNKLNLPAEKVEVLLDQWKLARYDAMKVPSKTDLDAFLSNKIIDENTYRQEMYKLGYADKYINWYIEAKGKERVGE